MTKGNAVRDLLERHSKADFVFCAGDDRTDEDMMRAIPEAFRKRTVTCWVGAPNSHADYWRESNQALLSELEQMATMWEKATRAGERSAPLSTPKKQAPPRAGKTATKTASTAKSASAAKKVGQKATKKPSVRTPSKRTARG